MRGGLVFFRGAGSAARAYLESDHSHADDYYLEHGGAVAQWAALDGTGATIDAAQLSGPEYQAWVDWKDPHTGVSRGVPREEVRVRKDGELRIGQASPRFVEMTVNCDKSLSVAAALSPAVSAALDDAQAAAVAAMHQYMADNSVTRVGARGEQRLVPVERLEAVAVVHRTSRAGDPHRHVHVQYSTRVLAEGKWRGLWTGPTLKQQGALRGIGEASINSHKGLLQALAAEGFVFDAATGKVTNLAPHAQLMSKRATQIDRNVTRLEGEWRMTHPGQEPDQTLRREWDAQAWALERPQKRHATGHGEQNWIDELRTAGLPVDGFEPGTVTAGTLQDINFEKLRADVLATVEQRRSAWSLADLEGAVGVAVGAAGVHAEPAELIAFQRDIADRIAAALPRLETGIPGVMPRWVRDVTSTRVLKVERTIRDGFTSRGLRSGFGFGDDFRPIGKLNLQQSQAAVAIASAAPLVVVEGAAGSGKTTMLEQASALAGTQGRELLVLAPTLRAAQEARRGAGVDADSAHKLAHEYGFRWTDDNRWTRLQPGEVDPATGAIYDGPSPDFQLTAQTRIVVDEAGMIDQDLAVALLTISDETGATIALIGDRAQLPAVGRGGVMDIAIAASPRPIDLTELHRFRQPGYAELTLQLRHREDPGGLFDRLLERGNIVVHTTDAQAWTGLTGVVTQQARAGAQVAVAAASNDTATQLNALVQDAHARAGHTRTPAVDVAGSDGLSLRTGDRVMTRRNDKTTGVANRDIWTVKRVHPTGAVTLADIDHPARTATVSRGYVEQHVHLAYASTEYGVQGATVDIGHGVLTDSSAAGAVYVAATRGKHLNTIHVVAGDTDEARQMFVDAMRREAGDRGVEAARDAVHRDLDGITLDHAEPSYDPALRAERIAAEQRSHDNRMKAWERDTAQWETRHPGHSAENVAAATKRLQGELDETTRDVGTLERALTAGVDQQRRGEWAADHAAVDHARQQVHSPGADPAAAAATYRRAVEQFTVKHGHEPVPVPPKTIREQWQQTAIAPGVDPRLDAARRRQHTVAAALRDLQTDPVPARPTPPAQGTPAQEAAKDARYRDDRQRKPRTPTRDARLAELQAANARLAESTSRRAEQPAPRADRPADAPPQPGIRRRGPRL